MSNKKKLPKIMAIVGPTASGKTTIAIRLAKKFKGELISVDSRQIYKGMDIGTAKDKSYPQHLIDILSPKQAWNIQSFKDRATKEIKKILNKNKLPILIGGSCLYLDALLYNFKIPAVKPDLKLRKELAALPIRVLETKLKKLDPKAGEIAANNKRRLIRALEVIMKTGGWFYSQRQKGLPFFQALIIGLKIPREKLYEKINGRVDLQIKTGLVQETEKLMKKYGVNAFALQNTIGYKELIPYFRNEITLDKAVQEIKTNSRHYAKRQITWFKKQPAIHWLTKPAEAEKLVREFIKTKL